MRPRTMRPRALLPGLALCLLLAAALLARAALAQGDVPSAPDAALSLQRAVFSAGCPPSTGGAFAVAATAGQPLAGWTGSGATTLEAGFWSSPALEPPPASRRVWLPLVMRSAP